MHLTTGNAHDADTQGTGWFIGFSPWTLLDPSGLLHVPRDQALTGLCIKWHDHPAGHDSGDGKPVSEGRTVSVLVGGAAPRFVLQFSDSPAFEPERTHTVELCRHGDFAAWGEGLHHRWHCHGAATVLTVRWAPQGMA